VAANASSPRSRARQHVVAPRHAGEIDDELLAILRRAYDAAG
jgi:hypothetical protein